MLYECEIENLSFWET